jgi:hypothetical protein
VNTSLTGEDIMKKIIALVLVFPLMATAVFAEPVGMAAGILQTTGRVIYSSYLAYTSKVFDGKEGWSSNKINFYKYLNGIAVLAYPDLFDSNGNIVQESWGLILKDIDDMILMGSFPWEAMNWEVKDRDYCADLLKYFTENYIMYLSVMEQIGRDFEVVLE